MSETRLCWCAMAALVLLRLAIGTHFLYEGLHKIESHRSGNSPFSAEGYLAYSSGPFRHWFRSQLDDPDGLERLDPAGFPTLLEKTLSNLDRRHGLTEQQRTSARAKMRELELAKEQFFNDAENQAKLKNYRESIEQLLKDEQGAPAFVRDHAAAKRKDLAKLREELLGPVDGWTKSLQNHVMSNLEPEQIAQDSPERFDRVAQSLNLPFRLEWPQRRIDQINLVTMCGLTLSGGLLIVGLFSRLSALWAAAFLAMIYLANPAPPLGAGNPADPGHYMYVNKELVECLAALVLATIPTGRWLGLDALIRGLITRRLGGGSAPRPQLG